MRFTRLFTTSLLLSLSHLAPASADRLLDQSNTDVEAAYVDANGVIVYPESFPWGRLASKLKDAAKPRVCGGHLDAAGRLGKRTPTCPYGYAIACNAYASNPCCPVDTPICCSGGTVCCANGQFCQGTSTCCAIGQVGCGEACCDYGQVCCGSLCCGAGFTCGTGNTTCVPPPGYTSASSSSSSSSSSSTSSSSSSSIATRSPPIYTTGSNSNPYGYNPSYTPSSSSSTPSTYPTGCVTNCTTTTSNTNISIVGGVLGAACGVLILLALWLWWRKRHTEQTYASTYGPKPTEEPKPATTYTPAPETTQPAPADSYTPAKETPAPTTNNY